MQIESKTDAYKEAEKVDFLTTEYEKKYYATVLLKAAEWGRKKEQENKDYYKRNRLIDKYR